MTRSFADSRPFPAAAHVALRDGQLRTNLARATATIRAKRDRAVGELPDLEELRLGAESVKQDALSRLDELLVELETNVHAAGGHVHWARDAAEANAIVTRLVVATGEHEVVKVKSMTTAEIGLNDALAAAGIDARETDLAELIVQLGDDLPSHIVVPAIHRNRAEIRSTFATEMGRHGVPAPDGLSDDPADLAGAARVHLRDRFLSAKVAVSGANFAVAESGSLVVVESEGNGRMCLTLAETLISVVGIDKVVPSYRDLEIFLQLLPRSATGERMNPYTSIWTGVTPGDGPTQFHLVLLDNGRSDALADTVGRQALRCIRCAACLNVCPVYERVGGHAYGSVYPGPIGAVLTPQLDHVASDPVAASLPFASTLCGACFAVCPVRIDIPRLLVHLRGEVVDAKRAEGPTLESAAMAVAGYVLEDATRLGRLERVGALLGRALARRGRVTRLPGALGGWTEARDAPLPAVRSFRDWWLDDHRDAPGTPQGRGRPPADGSARRALATALVPRPRGRAGSELAGREKRRGPVAPGTDSGAAARSVGARVEAPTPDGARSAVLESIRAALETEHADPPVGIRRAYLGRGERVIESPVALFTSRLEDYKAHVVQVTPDDLPGAVAAALAQSGARSVVVPSDLPSVWLREVDHTTIAVVSDASHLGPVELDRVDATVTACAVAIAETGTIVLDGGTGQGRRICSLVPDHLVVVVLADQVVGTVPDALALLRPSAPQTFISGPSATSDIELDRVEGVHGPRRLDVIVVAGGPAGWAGVGASSTASGAGR